MVREQVANVSVLGGCGGTAMHAHAHHSHHRHAIHAASHHAHSRAGSVVSAPVRMHVAHLAPHAHHVTWSDPGLRHGPTAEKRETGDGPTEKQCPFRHERLLQTRNDNRCDPSPAMRMLATRKHQMVFLMVHAARHHADEAKAAQFGKVTRRSERRECRAAVYLGCREAPAVHAIQRAAHGSILAEASLYSELYHCDAVAVAPSLTWTIRKPDLLQALGRSPDFAHAWARRLTLDVQRARFQAEVLSLKTVAARLSAWIDWNGKLPEKGEWTRLASEIGVSPEALYRELAIRRSA
jgi:CRP-like cAMP-binding protein